MPTAGGQYRVLLYDQSGQTQVYDWSGSAAPLADASGTIGFKVSPPKPFYIAFISGPAGSPLYVTGVRAFYNAAFIQPIKP